jgi:hypothetical protein
MLQPLTCNIGEKVYHDDVFSMSPFGPIPFTSRVSPWPELHGFHAPSDLVWYKSDHLPQITLLIRIRRNQVGFSTIAFTKVDIN